MSYAISVWGSGGAINALKPLHIAQKKCIRILFNIPNVSKYCKGNTKPTCINNNILTVHNLYVCATMNKTYKLLGTNTSISVRKDLTISRLSENRLITLTGNNITALSNNYFYKVPNIWNTVFGDKNFEYTAYPESTPAHFFRNKVKTYLLHKQKLGNEKE